MITERVFGTLTDGREIKLYRIENSRGEYAELCDFGAVVHSLVVRDRAGKLGDVVLGCPDARHMEGKSYKGATIGRCANRIAYGRVRLHGETVQLEQNEGQNFRHGASGNWAFKLFSGEVTGENAVTFSLTDTGEGGFGDRAEARVTFSFGEDSRLTIHYEITGERETVLCPTNHAYFNLGDYSDARDMRLTLYASNLARRGPSGVPEGGLDPVAGTAWDFTGGAVLRDNMRLFPEGKAGYDDFYVVDSPRPGNLVAVLESERTGRVMKTYSDMQCAIIYTPVGARYPDKSGVQLPDFPAVCIECQFVPNAANVPEFSSPVFPAGKTLVTETVYEFSVK